MHTLTRTRYTGGTLVALTCCRCSMLLWMHSRDSRVWPIWRPDTYRFFAMVIELHICKGECAEPCLR